MVNATPRPLYARERDLVPILWEDGWAPGPVRTGAEKLASTGIRSPDRPVRSESLHRQCCPGPLVMYMSYNFEFVGCKQRAFLIIRHPFLLCFPLRKGYITLNTVRNTVGAVCYRGVTAQRGRIKEVFYVGRVFIFSEGLGRCDIPSGCRQRHREEGLRRRECERIRCRHMDRR